MTAELAAEFVRTGLWRPQRALSYVDEYTHAGRAIGSLPSRPSLRSVPGDQLPELNRLVLTALESTYFEEQGTAGGHGRGACSNWAGSMRHSMPPPG